MSVSVEILVTPSCPHGDPAIRLVEAVLAELAPGTQPKVGTVATLAEARELRFPGSPTVRVNGVDLEGADVGPSALACRRYGTAGIPPRWLVEAAVLRALKPKHILFLCVANSARSQMAEGLARSMAPSGVRVSSAGSEPTQIRPQAVAVLRESGIDAGTQYSKGMSDIEGEVDAVITLCAEEVCPAWLGKAWRVHWGLPDPAAVEGSGEEKLAAFRAVREELQRRFAVLFSG